MAIFYPRALDTRLPAGFRRSNGHYGQLVVMARLSFASMYMLMYAMVDSIGNVYPDFRFRILSS